ncbi:hypothetical protein Taro_039954 [Colocasia esculenta]|uniref:Uncharacterized protein n=1 Tax=Colocasia esculenta TaxID=4460 RepID=A0A843WX58_COLES|nr:hypothetical protein [Colocasia esculenta]
MEVTVKDTATVLPARPTPRRTLWCSDLDLLVARFHTSTVYFYRSSDSSQSLGCLLDAAVLKEALAEVLVDFYPAAGRKRLDGKDRWEIDCNGEGAVFLEAECNVGLDEFVGFGPGNEPKYMQLVPQPAAAAGSEHDVSACPLLLLQVTQFLCGGASLGVSCDHFLGDGFAALHLINSWADAARGVIPATPPLIDRTVLAPRDPPAPSFSHSEYQPPPSIAKQLTPDLEQPFVAASFRLNPADIVRLKSKVAAAGGKCSTYEAIVAHTWRCACIARALPADQKTRLYMPVSLLRRLDPPLPTSYLGNAVITAVCDATAGEVTRLPVDQVAGKVRATLSKIDDAYLRSMLDYLRLQSNLSEATQGTRFFGCPNLHVNSWVQLPIYGADFGWGKPVFMGSARERREGMVQILPQPSAEDGLTVAIGLHPAAMEEFKRDFYDF